ncbi:MAG TPA: hypothetical protein VGM74_03465 [Burkholderiaceae bacterium]
MSRRISEPPDWTARAARVATCALALSAAACSPALNWRTFVPEDSGLSMTFPCRPDRQARAVMLAGASVHMEMLACSAAGATYAVSFADVADPARIATLLSEWRSAAVANVQGAAGPLAPMQVAGMTPNDQAVRVSIEGKLPDGAGVQERAAFFVHGLRVYSASAIGAKLDPAAAEVFLAAWRFRTEPAARETRRCVVFVLRAQWQDGGLAASGPN